MKSLKELLSRVTGLKFDSADVAVFPNHDTTSDAELLAAYRLKCAWPELYYEKVQTLIRMTHPEFVVEVGVAYGYHAQHILRRNSAARYVGVDPYLASYDPEDVFDKDVADLFCTHPVDAMNRLFLSVSESLEGEFGHRFRLERAPSTTVARDFEDGSVPFVFIDGDHRYEAVLADLRAWWPKVEGGGACWR
jgi:hypothetical protein